MMRRLWAWLPDRVAGRLAVAIVIALLATQTISFAVVALSRPLQPPPYSALWLGERMTEIAAQVFGTVPARRPDIVARLPEREWLKVEWHEAKPLVIEASPHWPHGALRAILRRESGDALKEIIVEDTPPGGLFRPSMPRPRRSPPRPADDAAQLPDMPLFGPFIILAQGHDGTWLTIASLDRHSFFFMMQAAAWMISVGLVVAILSVWAARRLMAPIDGLARAAEQLGIDRAITPIKETGPRELAVIIRAFNRMQDRLHRFVNDRTQMLAAISHDLRTPLTRLRLRAETLPLEADRAAALADIGAMETMVTETLSFAAHDAHREAPQATDIATVVASLCDEMSDAGHDVRYRGARHLILFCQAVGMRRALANLIANAVRHGGKTCVLLDQRANVVRIIVADHGPGIPEAEMENVFRPFYKLNRAGGETPGSGLGLAIVRNIVRAHGGDVALHNRRRGGLAVTVTLPDIKSA